MAYHDDAGLAGTEGGIKPSAVTDKKSADRESVYKSEYAAAPVRTFIYLSKYSLTSALSLYCFFTRTITEPSSCSVVSVI